MLAVAAKAPEARVVWQPFPGAQAIAVACPCHHILLDGNRSGGKTDVQLMRFRMRVGRGYGPFWRGIIFDRTYKALDDLVAKSKRWFPLFGDGARFIGSTSSYRWVWPTGEELLFRRIKKLSDYEGYHGHEYPFIGWNELTKFPTSELYDRMMSTNRSSFVPAEHPLPDGLLLPPIPLEVVSTTNPHGAGHRWVKTRFVDPVKAGVPIRTATKVFNPQTQEEEEITKTQVRLALSWRENRKISPHYIAELENISDENLRKAWRDGDWDIVTGGALDDVWKPKRHVLPRFRIPPSWHLDRSFDWGSTHPFSVGWWAEANGEEATLVRPDGSTRPFCPPAGSLVLFEEWYGTKGIGTNQGLKMAAGDVARGILEREKKLREEGWIQGTIYPGPADNQIFESRESDVESIAKKMEDLGVAWTRSDKGPGSRKNGLQLLRDRLTAAAPKEGLPEEPGLYVMEHCRAWIATVPVVPRDPEDPDDVDTDSEDHPYDASRYRILAGNNRAATKLKVTFAH